MMRKGAPNTSGQMRNHGEVFLDVFAFLYCRLLCIAISMRICTLISLMYDQCQPFKRKVDIVIIIVLTVRPYQSLRKSCLWEQNE